MGEGGEERGKGPKRPRWLERLSRAVVERDCGRRCDTATPRGDKLRSASESDLVLGARTPGPLFCEKANGIIGS